MLSSEPEPADVAASYDRLLDMFQELSINENSETHAPDPTASGPQISNATSSAVDRVWHGTPLEILTPIMLQSFFSNFEGSEDSRITPVDPLPDLTLMKVNKECRQYFEQKLLPDTVMLVVTVHVCAACVTGLTRRYARLFGSSRKQPWATMARRTSTVTITTRCEGTLVNSYTIGTIYVPQRRFNILALSQMLLGATRSAIVHEDRKIDMHCHPRSMIGATQSAEVLGYLATLLHGYKEGSKTIAGDANLRMVLTPALQGTYPTYVTWTQASGAHQHFLNECQALLNTGTVAPYQVAETAAAAFRNFAAYYDPAPTENRQTLTSTELEEFMHRDIKGGCMMFLAFHGLSDFSHRYFTVPSQRFSAPVLKMNMRFRDLMLEQTNPRMRVLGYLCHLQHNNQFRRWKLADAPYVIHLSAMFQTFTRYRIIRLVQQMTDYTPEEMTRFYGGTQDELRDGLLICVGYLEDLHIQINTFRDLSEDETPFTIYDTYEMPAFIEGMRTLLLDVAKGQQGRTNDEWYERLDTKVFTIPAKPRVPTIAASDWENVRRTYEDVNNATLWFDRVQ